MRYALRLAVATSLFAFPLGTIAREVGNKAPYQAMGAPSNPKVEAHWNRFHDYAESTKLLRQLAERHPSLASLQSLGKSFGQREMWLLTITNSAAGEETGKPAFWIDGGIHANEIQSVEVVLYTAWFLLESYDQNPFVKRLLDERTFYLVPMMSPDSRDAHFYEPNTTHSPRTGQRPVDDDMDGRADEDGPDDLDGDGHLTQMRVKDTNGRWKTHPDYPALLIRAKDDEKGDYTLLGSEGIDNDGDGQVNEDGDGFYDPNRDWPWSWQPSYIQRGAGSYPFSVHENRLVAEFVMQHPNIAGAQSYHNAGGMLLYGPGAKSDRYEPADVRVYSQLAKTGEKILPGYRALNVANELYEVWGGEFDWFHSMRGAFTFTNELFTPFNYFRTEGHEGFFGGDETRHMFDKYLLLGDGFVPWHEVEHPQFGKVEVGGVKKNWMRQPPSFLLEEECHRNMAFTLYHADQMPKLKVQSIEVKSLGGELQQVTATIENERLIPTHSATDERKKLTPPDVISLDAQDANVLLALSSSDRFFRDPTEHKRHPHAVHLSNVPGHGIVYVRWLVRGDGPFNVVAKSIKGGASSARVD